MLLQPRLREIVQWLEGGNKIPAAKLADRFDVTSRTIRSDMQALNHVMQGAQVTLIRSKGYKLEISDPSRFESWKAQNFRAGTALELSTVEERQRYLLALLLTESGWSDIDDLADALYVSRNTLQNYLRKVRNQCEKYNLVYESRGFGGIRVRGPELARRSCLFNEAFERNLSDYITGFSPLESEVFSDIDLSALAARIRSTLTQNGLSCSDYSLKNLVLHTALALSASDHGMVFDEIQKENIPEQVLQAAKALLVSFQDADKDIPEREIEYLALHIVLNTRFLEGAMDENLQKVLHQMLDYIWKTWRFDLRDDSILFHDLCTHFYSIFHARLNGMSHPNPLLNTIRSSFPMAYDISLDAVNHVFSSQHLSEDETGYISLHIGAAIERCYAGTLKPAKVILVCGSGMATARMLEARLRSYFRDKLQVARICSFQEYQSLSESDLKSIDFAVSTVPLPSGGLPFAVVDFSLPVDNAESVARLLSSVQENRTGPEQFFDENLFVHFDKPVDKGQVLDALCKRLEDAGICDASVQASVLNREAIAHTNLSDVFAIPHPLAPEATRTKAAVALLDHPVKWNDTCGTVQIVFLLAFCKGEQENIEHLYDLLLEVAQSTQLQQAILKTKTYQEFRQVCLSK